MFIVHIIVNGLVQGVSFRYSVVEYAQKNRIVGTVQNLSATDKVEIFAQAPEDKIKNFTNWLKNNPGLSNINKIEILEKKEDAQTHYYSFRIL